MLRLLATTTTGLCDCTWVLCKSLLKRYQGNKDTERNCGRNPFDNDFEIEGLLNFTVDVAGEYENNTALPLTNEQIGAYIRKNEFAVESDTQNTRNNVEHKLSNESGNSKTPKNKDNIPGSFEYNHMTTTPTLSVVSHTPDTVSPTESINTQHFKLVDTDDSENDLETEFLDANKSENSNNLWFSNNNINGQNEQVIEMHPGFTNSNNSPDINMDDNFFFMNQSPNNMNKGSGSNNSPYDQSSHFNLDNNLNFYNNEINEVAKENDLEDENIFFQDFTLSPRISDAKPLKMMEVNKNDLYQKGSFSNNQYNSVLNFIDGDLDYAADLENAYGSLPVLPIVPMEQP